MPSSMANNTRKSSGWSLRKFLTAVSAVDMVKKKNVKSHLRTYSVSTSLSVFILTEKWIWSRDMHGRSRLFVFNKKFLKLPRF